jgi:carboxymethylenebutenolidase
MLPIITSISSFTSSGRAIALDIYLPDGDGPFPGVIALHGSGGNHASMSEPANQLAAQGFGVFVVHYFDRTGTTEANEKQTIFRNFPAWGKTVWDAVSHVAQHPQVDTERIGLLGFSLGAYLALSVASVDSRVKAVVEFFGGLPREMKFFMRRLCPVLILHGEADPTIPVAEAYDLEIELQRRKIPYDIKIYPAVGHGFSGQVWDDACLRTVAFLCKHLVHR